MCRLAQDGHPLSSMSFGVAGIITALVDLWLDKGWLRTVPTPGRILAAMSAGLVGAEEYNRAWANCAAKTMW